MQPPRIATDIPKAALCGCRRMPDDELLNDWHGRGKLVPAWRWDLADSALYPKRGMTVQYQESDLAFLKRLLAVEGLFCWFEHAQAEGESLGKHTLVSCPTVRTSTPRQNRDFFAVRQTRMPSNA